MMNKKLGGDVVVMQAGHVVDAFWGNDGWCHHGRFVLRNSPKGKFMSQVAGGVVPAGVLSQVSKKVGV